jgi:hypothetical protein
MNPFSQLLVAALTSVSLSLVVLALLSAPLVRVLARICPDDSASAFWLRYTQLMLTLVPLLATVVVEWLAGSGPPASVVRLTLMAVLVGLLFGLHAVGRRVGLFVRWPAAAPSPTGAQS